jgi:L-fuconolactonase
MAQENKTHNDVEARAKPVDQTWLDSGIEDVLEPDLPIIDPHHHLWDFRNYRYMLDEILADTGSGHNVRSTVFIECTAMWRPKGTCPDHMRPIGETEYVNGIAAMSASGRYGETRVAAGIVSHADLMLGEAVEEVLAAHDYAGGGRFRGIRYSVSHDDAPEIHNSHTGAPKDALRTPSVQAGLRKLGQMGYTFEAWMYHPQLENLSICADAAPNTKMVLNHCGGPLGIGPYSGKREELFATWKSGVQEAAKRSNVYVKLGGLGMVINGFDFQNQSKPPSSEDLEKAWKPYIETLIEAFGPNRCMFESNFPVDKISGSYRTYWNAFKRLAAGASDNEKAALFHDTAKSFYRL